MAATSERGDERQHSTRTQLVDRSILLRSNRRKVRVLSRELRPGPDLDTALGKADRFVVVDVETTGVYRTDRVIEIALLTVDRAGETIEVWETLVNPERDIGPTWLHGISAETVTTAPTFPEVASAVACRLDGAVLVAHNLSFDQRMLSDEFARMGVVGNFGAGIDTLALTRCRLTTACESLGIVNLHAHSARGDAESTATLLLRTIHEHLATTAPVAIFVGGAPSCRTTRREAGGGASASPPPEAFLVQLAQRTSLEGLDIDQLRYVQLLDWALVDLVLDTHERRLLLDLADDMGLSSERLSAVHDQYIGQLIDAATRDHLVTDGEYEQLLRAAAALGVSLDLVEDAVADYRPTSGATVLLEPGLRVCFTGAATDPVHGGELPRSELELLARAIGLEPVRSVTKKGCDVLAAADPASLSGKAAKARGYGIPIVGVADLLAASLDDTIAAQLTS